MEDGAGVRRGTSLHVSRLACLSPGYPRRRGGFVMGLRNPAWAAAALFMLPVAAIAALVQPAGLNPRMRAPAGEDAVFVLAGNGVHVFECRQSLLDPNVYVWSFVAPDAT